MASKRGRYSVPPKRTRIEEKPFAHPTDHEALVLEVLAHLRSIGHVSLDAVLTATRYDCIEDVVYINGAPVEPWGTLDAQERARYLSELAKLVSRADDILSARAKEEALVKEAAVFLRSVLDGALRIGK